MTLEPQTLLLIAAAGLGAGILNVLAGGGSLLVMPVLLAAGLPGPLTNGSTRVGIVAQNVAAQLRYFRGGQRPDKTTFLLALYTLPGAAAGAYLGVRLEGPAFRWVLAAVMLTAWGSMVAGWVRERRGARRRSEGQARSEPERGPPPAWVAPLAMTVVGLYGGFIQAGIGFLLMAVLERVLKLDLVRVNVLKVWIVMPYTLVALAIFASRGAVHLEVGLVLATGMTLGGWLGARLALARGSGFIRVVYSVALLGLLLKMFLDLPA